MKFQEQEEEKVFMSDDLLDVAETESILAGTVPAVSFGQVNINGTSLKGAPTTFGNGSGPLIGYVPLPEPSSYFVGIVDLRGMNNEQPDDILSLTGTVSSVEHLANGTTILQILLGNEDYFSLVRRPLKDLVALEVKLVDPMGNQATLVKEQVVDYLKVEFRENYVVAYFRFKA